MDFYNACRFHSFVHHTNMHPVLTWIMLAKYIRRSPKARGMWRWPIIEWSQLHTDQCLVFALLYTNYFNKPALNRINVWRCVSSTCPTFVLTEVSILKMRCTSMHKQGMYKKQSDQTPHHTHTRAVRNPRPVVKKVTPLLLNPGNRSQWDKEQRLELVWMQQPCTPY